MPTAVARPPHAEPDRPALDAARSGPAPASPDLLDPPRRRAAPRAWLGRHAAGVCAAAVVLLRLPFVSRAPGADEAGYLMVGAQWQPGGGSLYGGYWVDRPPLLITLFRLAAQLGGLVPLRLLGCVAAALVVLGAGRVARRVAGDRAAGWAALSAAGLCVSPLVGALEVNGELLAAPFVVWGILAALTALGTDSRRRATGWAALAGVALVGAVLVKQNFLDVGVFATVTALVAWGRRTTSGRRLAGLAAAFVAGGSLGLVIVAAWTVAHGTSLVSVFDAAYPFRVEAGRVIAASHHQTATTRLWALAGAWLLCGGALVMAWTGWALWTRRLRDTAVWGLAGTVCVEVASVLGGGSYWHHYLVQIVAPVAVLAGVLAARAVPGGRVLLLAGAAVSLVAWSIALPGPTSSVGSTVGASIGAAARPHDTIVTVYGHADVSQASGLSSPYPFLWSLPIKTLDPGLTRLDQVLGGPQAPTWLVTWGAVSSWGVDSTGTSALVAERYHRVARLLGRTVYLRDGVVRATPVVPAQRT